MDIGAGLYMYDAVVEKFTFAISSPDEFLSLLVGRSVGLGHKFLDSGSQPSLNGSSRNSQTSWTWGQTLEPTF